MKKPKENLDAYVNFAMRHFPADLKGLKEGAD